MDYPRMMYHQDGRTQTALDPDHEASMDAEWSREPTEVHRLAPNGSAPGTVQPAHQSGGDDLIERLIARMREEFPSLGGEPRRGPGRPPNPRPVSADRGATRNVELLKE